ncbi:MAG: phosphatidylglycerol lysyltransferase domain-containing protein [Paracoccaceae bacterium]
MSGPGAGARVRRGGNYRRAALSLGVGGLLLWLLLNRLSAIEPQEVAHAFASLPAHAWGLAAGATAASFWAVGHYDAVIHRHFATGLPEGRSRLAGICAIAVSQMIGLGVVSGAVLRWRMLPEIGALAAARLTAAVALSFLGAWAMVTSAVLVLFPGAPFKAPALLALCLGGALAAVSIAAPRIGALRFRWPNAVTLGRLLALCVIDTGAAALAFWFLCPAGVDLSFSALLPAFLVALGAGLISGAPGGMGAFEMTLLALLPAEPQAELLAAVLAWRLVYFALPATLGAAVAIRGPRSRPKAAPGRPSAAHLALGPAEAQLYRQGEHDLLGGAREGVWLAGRTAHCLVGLFDPAPARLGRPRAMAALGRQARAENRIAVLYKAAPRLAAAARQAGFHVRAIAREAVLDLAAWDLTLPARAGLRRKLRRAEAAGLRVLPCPARPDWPALDRIAEDWARAHGGERGFSMGRYARGYVAGQRLFVALLDGRPVAFVTFHANPGEWTLDLMRHQGAIPDGTMHLLVQAAIDLARAEGAARLSLAAVPDPAPTPGPAWMQALPHRLLAEGAEGLVRFKSAFAPRWERRYLCLPHAAYLPLAAAEIARAIHRPKPLRSAANMRQIEHDHEELAFAPAGSAWQDGPVPLQPRF